MSGKMEPMGNVNSLPPETRGLTASGGIHHECGSEVATSFSNDAAAGQGLVEYALILLFVASVVVLQLTVFGGRVQELYTTIVNGLPF